MIWVEPFNSTSNSIFSCFNLRLTQIFIASLNWFFLWLHKCWHFWLDILKTAEFCASDYLTNVWAEWEWTRATTKEEVPRKHSSRKPFFLPKKIVSYTNSHSNSEANNIFILKEFKMVSKKSEKIAIIMWSLIIEAN